jgi:hypothetical protein
MCFIGVAHLTIGGHVASAKAFRRLALALDDAIESAHMGHPDFRAHGRIFATIQHDPQWGALMLTPEQQKMFLRDYPDSFKPAAGAWGAGGSTLVHFGSLEEDTLGEGLTLAWQNAAAKSAATKNTKKDTRTQTTKRTARKKR